MTPRAILLAFSLLAFACAANGAPTVDSTTVIGTLTGPGATLHPDNQNPVVIDYHGTDLGFTYRHGDFLHFLFGDSWNTAANAATDPDYNDVYGTVDLTLFGAPGTFSSLNMPLIKLGQRSSTSEALGINPQVIMDGFKTPIGGFSNGTDQYGVFLVAKPQACTTNAHCTAISSGLTCDTGLGWHGAAPWDPYEITGVCTDDMWFCNDNTAFLVPGSGFCRDTTSKIFANTAAGRQAAVALPIRVAVRSTTNPNLYTNPKVILTNKFYNPAIATVESFVEANGGNWVNQNYNVATGSGGNRRVFIWGRPAYAGVKAKGRRAALYFAYADMPSGNPSTFTVKYFTGVVGGVPQFNTNQSLAVPLNLSSPTGDVVDEQYDIVEHTSVVWIDHLKKWVMFYGGGVTRLPSLVGFTCGVLELFTGPDCTDVDMSNGAVRMRTADYPWGPWTAPQDVFVGGDPYAASLQAQYAPGGVLRHPNCTTSGCAAHSPISLYSASGEYGWLYGANIIQPWVTPMGSSVDVYWNASTWDPYRVILLRTRIDP